MTITTGDLHFLQRNSEYGALLPPLCYLEHKYIHYSQMSHSVLIVNK